MNPDRFKRRTENTKILDLDASQLTPEMLDKLAEHLIRKERGNLSPAEMERATTMIAAGETLEGTFERADGEEKPADGAAADADWFDEEANE